MILYTGNRTENTELHAVYSIISDVGLCKTVMKLKRPMMDSAMLQNVYNLSFFRMIFVVTLIVLLASGVWIIRRFNMKNDQWETRSEDFVKQLNSLGAQLPPGGTGAINLPACDADELILLPAYCTQRDVAVCLFGRPPKLLRKLLTISGDDHIAPALVWLHDSNIISINRIRLSGGVDLRLKIWKLHGPREIKVIKDARSPNGFLSIRFVEY